jgi:hypothetical protein
MFLKKGGEISPPSYFAHPAFFNAAISAYRQAECCANEGSHLLHAVIDF